MKAKHIFTLSIIVITAFLYSCGGDTNEEKSTGTASEVILEEPTPVNDKGYGKFQNVELSTELDAKMIATGQNVYDVKCAACHKLTSEKLVGPGWENVTNRRTPEWILNFVTNVDEMLEKDPESQAMLEICMVRMPNQNLSDDEAYGVFEFMRKNDSK